MSENEKTVDTTVAPEEQELPTAECVSQTDKEAKECEVAEEKRGRKRRITAAVFAIIMLFAVLLIGGRYAVGSWEV